MRELRRRAKLFRRVEKHFEEQRTRHERKERRKRNQARKAAHEDRPRERLTLADLDDEDELRLPRSSGSRARCGREPEPSPLGGAGGATALVVGVARTRCRLRREDGDVDAELAPHLPTSPVVGDRVVLEPGREPPRVVGVDERTSWLSRRDPADRHRERLLAANLDVAAIVVAAGPAGLKTRLVDRFLVVALAGHVAPLVVVNKIDLLSAAERERVGAELDAYRAIDVDVLTVSAKDGSGLDALHERLRGRLSALVGPSGVGKTSLVNALDPSSERRTGPVRTTDGRGRHTTTAAELVELAGGVRLVDTPGIRQLALHEPTPDEILAAFPELEPRRLGCRFGDCRHDGEPGCGAATAVEEGRVTAGRLESWSRILASD